MFAWAGSDAYTSYLLFPGILLQAVSCIITIITCTHMATLAGEHAATARALFSGAGSSSVVIYLIVKILYKEGFSRKISISVLAACWLLVLLYSYFLMPHYKVAKSSLTEMEKDKHSGDEAEQDNQISDRTENTTITNLNNRIATLSENIDIQYKGHTHTSQITIIPSNENQVSPDVIPTLFQCMKTLPFLFLVIWFSIMFLAVFAFLGIYNPWVMKLPGGDDEIVSHLMNVLAYCQLSGMLISLFPGVIIDFVRKQTKDHGGMTQGVATVPLSVIGTSMAAIIYVCVIMNKISAVTVAAIVSVFARIFMFGTAINFISLIFPGEHYGKLFGIDHFIAGVVNLLQYPLFIWADSSDSYFGMSLLLLIGSCLAFCYPIYMLVDRAEESKSTK